MILIRCIIFFSKIQDLSQRFDKMDENNVISNLEIKKNGSIFS